MSPLRPDQSHDLGDAPKQQTAGTKPEPTLGATARAGAAPSSANPPAPPVEFVSYLPRPSTATVERLCPEYLDREMDPEDPQASYEDLIRNMGGRMAALNELTRKAEEAYPEPEGDLSEREWGQRQVIEFIRMEHSKLSNKFLELASGR